MKRIIPIILLLSLFSLSYVQGCDDEFRQVGHELLDAPICVPGTPERVVLDPFYNLQMGLELALPIVGSTTSGAAFPAAVTDDQLIGVTDIGQFDVPNLEVVTQLNPDLILADACFHKSNQEQLSATAYRVSAERRPEQY